VRFLGVSRQGEFENTRKQIECVSKRLAGEIFFRGEIFFPGIFLTFFLSDFFVALVKRLSVRGTQKRDKKMCCGVVRLIFFPHADFLLLRFWAFRDKGNSKTRLKQTRHRTRV
jgi:hypothetical protein